MYTCNDNVLNLFCIRAVKREIKMYVYKLAGTQNILKRLDNTHRKCDNN